MLADSVGLALLVVLETLSPAERLAFVLHDLFAVPFDEIAPIVGPLARGDAGSSRAGPAGACGGRRRRPTPTSPRSARSSTRSWPRRAAATSTRCSPCSIPTSRCASTRAPGCTSSGAPPRWPGRRCTFARLAPFARPALVNGAVGMVTVVDGPLVSVMAMTVRDGRIVELDILADPDRLATLPS